ncbi:MAG: sigma-70 family RNA polymerase sigma factor [Polyangiaceae bacterium]|nr:sigma-70 family RNA polymerase sigma factor [Polyangiaceae bacterium]
MSNDNLSTEGRALLAQLQPTIRRAATAVAGRFGASRDDLMGVGFLAAIEVTRTFDPRRNDDIAAFGYQRIAGEMIDHVLRERRTDHHRLVVTAHRFVSKVSGVIEVGDPFADEPTPWMEVRAALDTCAAAAVVALGAGREPSDPEQAIDELRLGIAMARAVRRLSDEHRRLIDLVFFEERTLDEAAVALGLSSRTARRRKREALEALRDALIAEHDALGGA